MAEPLVSVGIPTFNRAESMRRAAASVLAQSYRHLELTISDNASSDGTERVCHELCAGDPRVRYLRSPVNRGPTANFNTLFASARGEYAMVLSDDDWLEEHYVERCLELLRARSDHVLACGVARYVARHRATHSGVVLRLDDPDPGVRIARYLHNVDENGLFYGLVPTAVRQRAAPLRDALGNDWLLVAAILAQGKATTLEDTAIMRELGGTSADISKLVRTLALPRWQARLPHVTIAGELVGDVLWRNDAYASLTRRERVALAIRGASAVFDWRSEVWHMTMPTFAALGQRRGLRWLWRLYLGVARRAGATQSGRET
jgi:glycosyltransferase involved in cell wall biosynthesis